MRKTWQRIFLLCVACMICMCGLCFAGNEKWMNYNYYGTPVYSFYVDANSITTCEYEGRKYLDIILKCEKHNGPVTIYHDLFDVENQTMCVLEAKNESKEGWSDYDYSKIIRIPYPISNYEYLEKLLTWVEQNRPDVINEIRTFNQSASGRNTDAPNGVMPNPSDDADMHKYTLVDYYDSKGAIPAFCPLGRRYEYGKETSSWATIYRNPYKEGGEYIIICGWVEPKGTMNAEGPYLFEYQDTFDYDPDEGWFTFTGSENTMGDLNRYYMRARVGEAPNTIEVEWITGERGTGDIPNAPTLRTDIPNAHEYYTQRFVAQSEVEIGNNFWIQDVTAEPYRFVSEYKIRTNQNGYVTGVIDNLDTAPISAMFAFLDFLNEGNTTDMILEPTPGRTLPHRSLLKHPELYGEPNNGMYYSNNS